MNRIIIAAVAVAAAAFTSTMAHGQPYDLDGEAIQDTFPSLVAVETFSTDNDKSITVDGQTYYEDYYGVAVQGSIGVRGEADSGRTLFLRYDLENAVFFNGSYVADGFTTQTTDWVVPDGGIVPGEFPTLEAGGHGQNYIVESTSPVRGGPGFTQDQLIDFHLNGIAILPEKPVSLTYTVYLDLGDALQRRNPVVTKTAANIINSTRGLRHEVFPGGVVASLSSGFTQLPFADYRWSMGSLRTDIGTTADGRLVGSALADPDRASNIFSLSQIAKLGERGSTITFRGDFSVGNFSVFAHWLFNRLSPRAVTTRENGEVLEKVTITAPDVLPFGRRYTFAHLQIEVPADNTTLIPEGEYTVAVDYEALPNRAIPPLDLAETVIGRIYWQGAKAQIPFLTTYSGYNQRVVIVNRYTQPLSYAFSFVAEDGVTATPGEAAEGVVPAQGRAVLKATDIVSLEGKTRTAATLNMAAFSGSVDVATVQVNLNDNGTDTVVLETTTSISNTPPLPAAPPSALQAKRR